MGMWGNSGSAVGFGAGPDGVRQQLVGRSGAHGFDARAGVVARVGDIDDRGIIRGARGERGGDASARHDGGGQGSE